MTISEKKIQGYKPTCELASSGCLSAYTANMGFVVLVSI